MIVEGNDGQQKNEEARQLWLFVEEQLLLQDRGVCGCRVGARSGGTVTRRAPMKRISCQISALMFFMFQIGQKLIWSDVKVALNYGSSCRPVQTEASFGKNRICDLQLNNLMCDVEL